MYPIKFDWVEISSPYQNPLPIESMGCRGTIADFEGAPIEGAITRTNGCGGVFLQKNVDQISDGRRITTNNELYIFQLQIIILLIILINFSKLTDEQGVNAIIVHISPHNNNNNKKTVLGPPV